MDINEKYVIENLLDFYNYLIAHFVKMNKKTYNFIINNINNVFKIDNNYLINTFAGIKIIIDENIKDYQIKFE